MWTSIEEENIAPSDTFLVKFAEFLKSKNCKVPFHVPTVAEPTQIEEPLTTNQIKPKATVTRKTVQKEADQTLTPNTIPVGKVSNKQE